MHKKEYDGSVVVSGYENFKHSEKCEGCDKHANTSPPVRESMSKEERDVPQLYKPIYAESPLRREPMSTDCDCVNPSRIIVEPTDVRTAMEDDDKKGAKHDTEKIRLDLIPCEALEQMGRAFTHGAQKYGAYNYRQGIDYSRLYGATLRHLNAFWGGEDIDEDSGLPHLALAGSEVCMLIAMDEKFDDRYKKEI